MQLTLLPWCTFAMSLWSLMDLYTQAKKRGGDCQLAQDLNDIASLSSILSTPVAAFCHEAMKDPFVSNMRAIKELCANGANDASTPLQLAQKTCSNQISRVWLHGSCLVAIKVLFHFLSLFVDYERSMSPDKVSHYSQALWRDSKSMTGNSSSSFVATRE